MVGNDGFATFGPVHLAYLAVCIAVVVVLVVRYRKAPHGLAWGNTRRNMLLFAAIVPIALLVSHDILDAAADAFSPNWWPLHVCNFCEYLCLIYALHPNETAGDVLFGVGLPSAILALLFPSWGYCDPFTWPVICGFFEHAFLLAFVLMLLAGGDFTPRLKRMWVPIVALAVYALVMYPFNYAFEANFAFLREPSTGSPLVAWAEVLGNPGYILPLAAAFVAVIAALYLAFTWVGARRRR